jgi:RNA 2',3'-cyclic 3'-phosphodiesterase
MEKKRLFLGMEVHAPWPEVFPGGRILLEPDRHLTLAFLGDHFLPSVIDLMQDFPDPGFRVGLAGIFDHPVFLPRREPKTAGWRVLLLEQSDLFLTFQRRLCHWLEEEGLSNGPDRGEYLAHVTIARSPFVIHEWKKAFQPLPLFLKSIHLCESLGLSRYNVCWTHEILAPFEGKEHMADLAFTIRGETTQQLFIHAILALAFHFPPLIDYMEQIEPHGLDDLIFQLNHMIARADADEGSPFKAVSYHSAMIERENILEWEMIVDV